MAVVLTTIARFWDLNFLGVSQPKPMQGFSPNMQDTFK